MTFNNFVKQVAKWEGCRLKAYYDSGGTLTIGYGFTRSVIDSLNENTTITQERADKLLKQIVKKYMNAVVNECKHHNLMFTCNQILALTDFTYNCGIGAMQNLLKQPTHEKIVEHLLMYNKVTINGVKTFSQGLANRRDYEAVLYNKKCSCTVPCSYKN